MRDNGSGRGFEKDEKRGMTRAKPRKKTGFKTRRPVWRQGRNPLWERVGRNDIAGRKKSPEKKGEDCNGRKKEKTKKEGEKERPTLEKEARKVGRLGLGWKAAMVAGEKGQGPQRNFPILAQAKKKKDGAGLNVPQLMGGRSGGTSWTRKRVLGLERSTAKREGRGIRVSKSRGRCCPLDWNHGKIKSHANRQTGFTAQFLFAKSKAAKTS